MFDWFFEFLYSLTELLLHIIDFIMQATNKISGIDTITIKGEETDFISYLIQNDKVTYAFAITSILGFILLILLTVIQIVMTYTKEKSEESPIQVAKRAAKNVLVLLLVPTFMVTFIILTNAFVRALYQATAVGSVSLPQFMFAIFAEDAAASGVTFDQLADGVTVPYDASWSTLSSAVDMYDFAYFYSWLIGGLVVYLLLCTILMLIERSISIVLLYIISPFVVAASVMDDGAKFKSWRDQIMVKFLTGHGAIIAINIYILVVSFIIDPAFRFFDSWSLNCFTKLLFVVGGALAVKQVQAIIGNLIQVGAGDKAVAENERASSSLGRAMTSPFRGVRNIANFARDSAQQGFLGTVANRFGFKTARDYGAMSKTQKANMAAKNEMKDKRDQRQAERIANIIKGSALGGGGSSNNLNATEASNTSNKNNMDALGGADREKSLGEKMIDNSIKDSANDAK